MHKICNSNENCGEISNSESREVTQKWGVPLSGSSSEEEMVSKYFDFILQIYFFSFFKGKMLLETPNLAFLVKIQGTVLGVSFVPPLGGASGSVGRWKPASRSFSLL